jgi:hypothetical protein
VPDDGSGNFGALAYEMAIRDQICGRTRAHDPIPSTTT